MRWLLGKLKTLGKWWLIFAGILVVLGIVGNLVTQDSEKEQQVTSPSEGKKEQKMSYSYVSDSGTTERNVENIALEVFGETVNWDGAEKQTIMSIEMVKQVDMGENPDLLDIGEYMAKISYRADINEQSAGTIRMMLLDQAMDFAAKLFQDPRCSEVVRYMLMPHLEVLDKYNKEKWLKLPK